MMLAVDVVQPNKPFLIELDVLDILKLYIHTGDNKVVRFDGEWDVPTYRKM